jgi:peptidoglycan LD-endopeptidase LytH
MTRGAKTLAAVAAAFAAGVAADSWIRVYGPPQPAAHREQFDAPGPAIAERPRGSHDAVERAATGTTGSLRLRLPIDGADVESLQDDFAESREGHAHEAVDILAPRNTPVHAVADGTIAKLFLSKAGGITIYQFDASQRYCYYYAHLERYAAGLAEGQAIAQGQVVGYVGTSGNAPPDTPHLHFAIFELGPEKHWWQGKAVDPYLVFKGAAH